MTKEQHDSINPTAFAMRWWNIENPDAEQYSFDDHRNARPGGIEMKLWNLNFPEREQYTHEDIERVTGIRYTTEDSRSALEDALTLNAIEQSCK